jgi:uncharacterized membrane protein YccC
MAAPDPESLGLLGKVIAAGAAVVVPIWWARTWFERRMARKADKDAVEKIEGGIKDELTIHRGYFKDVFNQIRESDNKSEERHRELLMHLVKKGD